MSDQEPTTNPDPQPTPSRKGIGGPRTPEGRRRSSLNACKTLITSKIHLCSPEEQPAFDAHMSAYREALAPVGILEIELVAEISKMKWRLKRASSVEDSIFSQGHLDHAENMNTGHAAVDSCLAEGMVWKEQAKNLLLISLYETRFRRAVEKDMATLQALQEKRKASYARAQDEAIRLLQLALSEGKDYDPGDDFVPASAHGQFVFSASDLSRVIDRAARIGRSYDVNKRPPTFPKKAA
ncbi:MAG: hypothetical protein WBY44_06270 [Bryobacteraceae bacterium]|jgi:hypothetical protein